MSEFNSKLLREKSKDKAKRMANGSGPGDDPTKSIDASGWKEPTDMNNSAQTGMRPVSRRQFKKGGMVVHGEKGACRADRKPRKAGGRVAEHINRDVRAANHEIAKPHVGGFKAGGSANFRKQMHSDVGEDTKLVKHMVKKDALRVAKRNGGGKFAARPHKAHGGAAEDPAGLRPKGDRIPRKSGGRTKGKTNIMIHIGAPQQAPQMPTPAAPVKPPMGVPVPPPMPPQGGPQGMPPGMPPMGLGAGGPGAPQMPMPRKRGGRTYMKLEAGGGSGLGRLQKTKEAARTYGGVK